MDEFEWTIEEQPSLEWEIIEAVIKPEQTKNVTPTYEAQAITPDEGFTLGRVNVGAIPEPTAEIDITVNGDFDVADYGTAHVAVVPNLDTATVTPTKQTQTVEPGHGFDGLSEVIVEPIPDDYVIPTGSVEITQNGNVDISGKATAIVNVPGIVPTGTKQISITANGTTTEDVSDYADAEITVNVPTGLKNGEIIKLNHEVVEVGENNIQTGADMAAYIAAAKISTGILAMISIRQKPSYQYNEMMGFGTWRSMNSSEGARYRNGQLNVFPYGNSSYSCICPVGTIFDVYYCEAVF